MLLRDVPLRLLLLLAFVFAGIIPLMIASLSSWSAARDSMNDQALRQLESVRDLQRAHIERFFETQIEEMEVLAADPATRQALHELRAWFGESPRAGRVRGLREGRFEAPEDYHQLHAPIDAWLSVMAETKGFYDLFLMDPELGFTLFTVVKEEDFGIPIAEVESSLRDVWRTASTERRAAISDTRPYGPSGDIPAQFVAAPVMEGDELLGVVAGQISLEAIDAIMLERSGMGLTGESYLVGADLKMRSDSWLEPERRSVAASFGGTVKDHGVDSPATRAALEGQTGSGTIVGPGGRELLAAWAPVTLGGEHWAIIAEIETGEIDDKISLALNDRITLITLLSLVVVVVIALGLSTWITRGINDAGEQIERLVDRVLDGRLDHRGDPEAVAWDLRGLVHKTNALVDAFVRKADEKRRLEEVVQYNQRMEAIGTLAGGIAHDFNNILNCVATWGELVEDELEPGSRARPWMGEIMVAVDRAIELVSQIMTFGRQLRKEKRPLEVALMVNEAVKLIKVTFPPSVTVEKELRQRDLRVLADPTHLHQIVMNLCVNAFHAMQDHGGTLRVVLDRVRLEAGQHAELPPGDYCLLEVADTGCGMEPEVLDRVFEPFFTTRPLGMGTGMGLAVVHGLVGSYDGAIAFESTPGQGTTARVWLPLAPRDDSDDHAPPLESIVHGEGRVLFVDDEASLCAAMETTLSVLGYEPICHSDPLEALAWVERNPDAVDLVITDLNMPQLGGLALTRRLLALRPELPIILATGFDERIDEEGARALGARALLLKPWRRAALSRVIHRVLGGSG